MKNLYIQPETDIIVVETTVFMDLESNNETKTGTGQENESSNYVPGTDSGDHDGIVGGFNANSSNLWDE